MASGGHNALQINFVIAPHGSIIQYYTTVYSMDIIKLGQWGGGGGLRFISKLTIEVDSTSLICMLICCVRAAENSGGTSSDTYIHR